MLDRTEIERMRAAIEQNLVLASETNGGECIAVDDETGTEYGHKWRNGETRVNHEPDVDYVFAIRVELVAVESC